MPESTEGVGIWQWAMGEQRSGQRAGCGIGLLWRHTNAWSSCRSHHSGDPELEMERDTV